MSAENSSSETQRSSSHTTSAREQLLASFQDREYRHAFLEEYARSFIALQIRALRDERKLTQGRLGELTGKAQPWISQLEDPEYGKVTIATLLELAEAFDTALVVRFAPFSELLDRLATLRPEDYSVAGFDEDDFTQVSHETPKVDGTQRPKVVDIQDAPRRRRLRRQRPVNQRVRMPVVAAGAGA